MPATGVAAHRETVPRPGRPGAIPSHGDAGALTGIRAATWRHRNQDEVGRRKREQNREQERPRARSNAGAGGRAREQHRSRSGTGSRCGARTRSRTGGGSGGEEIQEQKSRGGRSSGEQMHREQKQAEQKQREEEQAGGGTASTNAGAGVGVRSGAPVEAGRDLRRPATGTGGTASSGPPRQERAVRPIRSNSHPLRIDPAQPAPITTGVSGAAVAPRAGAPPSRSPTSRTRPIRAPTIRDLLFAAAVRIGNTAAMRVPRSGLRNR
jgi:hypothetical protein